MTNSIPGLNDLQVRKSIAQERAIVEAVEQISRSLKEQEMNQSDLAAMLGVSRASVSKIMSGERNLTLKSLAGILFELGERVEFSRRPLNQKPLAFRTGYECAGRIGFNELQWPEGACNWEDERAPQIRSVQRLAS